MVVSEKRERQAVTGPGSLSGEARGQGKPQLQVTRLAKRYGVGEAVVEAIRDVSFTAEKGELVCVVGPSGGGKTTLLKCISGLLEPSSGTVEIGGRQVTEPPERLGVVFQDYGRSLFPWMSVLKNVALPLRGRGVARAQRERAAREALGAVGLADTGGRYPWELSGGMQQRVAIARALACEPELLLMDEPFASVDAQARADLEDLTLRLRESYGATVVVVTHDIDEAVYLADRVVVLTGSPATVRDCVAVPLPAPRDQIATKELEAYAALRSRVFAEVKGDSGAEGGKPRQLQAGWRAPA